MFKFKTINGICVFLQGIICVLILSSVNALPETPLLSLSIIVLSLLIILLLQHIINQNIRKEKRVLRQKQLQRKKRKSDRRKTLAEEIQFTELSQEVY